MIRINFCKTGRPVSDWNIDKEVEFLKKTALTPFAATKPVYDFSNFLLLDALRAEIAEDKISLDNISFSVDDVPLEVNRFGACPSYPKQGEAGGHFSTRVLIAAMNKRKVEDEVMFMEKYGVKSLKELAEVRKREKEQAALMVKADSEGQAPASDRDSTASREG